MLDSTVPLRLGAEFRLLDAVRFLENSPVPWCSLSRWEGGHATFQVRGDRYEPQPRFALPPLPEDETDSYWRLVSSLVDRPEGLDRSLRLWIDVTATAATWPLESRGLVTAIAIEAMTELLLPGFVPERAGYSIGDEERARQIIAGAGLPGRLAGRLLGLLQGRGASATDRLFELARLGVASSEEVEAWKELRHTIAHGTLPAMGQDLVDKVHRVRTLFSRLVFTAVGYEGLYLDYGTAGWPVRQHSCAAFKARGLEASSPRHRRSLEPTNRPGLRQPQSRCTFRPLRWCVRASLHAGATHDDSWCNPQLSRKRENAGLTEPLWPPRGNRRQPTACTMSAAFRQLVDEGYCDAGAPHSSARCVSHTSGPSVVSARTSRRPPRSGSSRSSSRRAKGRHRFIGDTTFEETCVGDGFRTRPDAVFSSRIVG